MKNQAKVNSLTQQRLRWHTKMWELWEVRTRISRYYCMYSRLMQNLYEIMHPIIIAGNSIYLLTSFEGHIRRFPCWISNVTLSIPGIRHFRVLVPSLDTREACNGPCIRINCKTEVAALAHHRRTTISGNLQTCTKVEFRCRFFSPTVLPPNYVSQTGEMLINRTEERKSGPGAKPLLSPSLEWNVYQKYLWAK